MSDMKALGDAFEALADRAAVAFPEDLRIQHAAQALLGGWALRNRALISDALRSMGWRPISEAPKDGAFFDVWMHNPDYPDGYRLPSCQFDMGEFRDANGHTLECHRDPITQEWRIYPTHYMPLPIAPEPKP